MTPAVGGQWADQEVERFRVLAKTHSGAQCAAILNREFGKSLTRNAIIGKAMRLGVKLHGSPGERAGKPRPKRRRKRQGPTRRVEPLPPQPPPATYQHVTGCRFAIGETAAGELLFCNDWIARPGEIEPTVKRTSPWYCCRHALGAINKEALRRWRLRHAEASYAEPRRAVDRRAAPLGLGCDHC